MRKLALFMLVLVLGSTAGFQAQASDFDGIWDKKRFLTRGRMIAVVPDDDTSVNIGGKSDVGDAVTPEVDITYFLTRNVALELIAATSQHSIYFNGNTDLGTAWLLPPTLTLQYHPWVENTLSPYFGAGVNYSYFYAEETGTGFTDLEVEGGFSFALQAGFDYWLNDHWGWNVDVKKLFLDIDGELNGGAITTDIELDPWIIGTGVSYRF